MPHGRSIQPGTRAGGKWHRPKYGGAGLGRVTLLKTKRKRKYYRFRKGALTGLGTGRANVIPRWLLRSNRTKKKYTEEPNRE